jgi:hypothetical protein
MHELILTDDGKEYLEKFDFYIRLCNVSTINLPT